MSKYFLLAVSAGVLSACTLTINGSGSEGNTTPQQSGPTSEDPSTDPTNPVFTTGTPTTGTPGTTEYATTDVPTTTESPSTGPVLTGSSEGDSTAGLESSGTDSSGTGSSGSDTGDTDDSTETGGGYGQCGWNAAQTYYACPGDNGVPGLADPKGNYPIDCRDQELAAGAACGQVGPAGCCTPEGNLYYCSNALLVEEKCGP